MTGGNVTRRTRLHIVYLVWLVSYVVPISFLTATATARGWLP